MMNDIDLREFDLRDWHYCRRCGARMEGVR